MAAYSNTSVAGGAVVRGSNAGPRKKQPKPGTAAQEKMMSDAKHIRELLAAYIDGDSDNYEFAQTMRAELPALLDKADKWDSYLRQQAVNERDAASAYTPPPKKYKKAVKDGLTTFEPE